MFQNFPAFFRIGTLQTDNNRQSAAHLWQDCCQPSRDLVTAGNSSKDINQHRVDLGIFHNDGKRGSDFVGRCAAAGQLRQLGQRVARGQVAGVDAASRLLLDVRLVEFAAQLQASESKYRAADRMFRGVWAAVTEQSVIGTDATGLIDAWNPGATKLLGPDRDDAEDKMHIFDFHLPEELEDRARELLTMLGLSDRLNHRPMELSGGQQQRVAIARALTNNPPLLLADEPTGNLDSEASEVVLEALRDAWRGTGTTVVLVTHDRELAGRMDRVLYLSDGRLATEAAPA